MYRVLIVDDEPIICKGLRSTIEWDSLGLEVCGEARNGVDALAMIRSMQPAILITDIRMPVMDGLTLIKSIRALDIPIKIIILSGFSDYAFLKEAIRLGVDGYLLKPIDNDELVANLQDLVSAIEHEMQSTQLYQGIELLRSNTLNRLVAHTIGTREFAEKAAFLEIPLQGNYYLCVVCTIGYDGGMADYDEKTFTMVFRIMNRALGDGCGLSFLDVHNRFVLILCADRKDALYPAADDVISAVTAQVRERSGLQVAAGRGMIAASLDDVWKSYAAASKLFDSAAPPPDGDEADPLGGNAADRALSYIAEHYQQALSLKHLAGLFAINTSYLGQLFKKTTGESFTSYVNKYRIEKAKELLMNTSLKVYEVAQAVGFTDYHYFLIIFKKITGTNPTDTRS